MIDRILPARFRVDGNRDFIESVVPMYLRPRLTVYDIGSGKSPVLKGAERIALGLRVVGFDLDAEELSRAPGDAYDRTICSDICQYGGSEDADVVICQAVLEHVRDARAAFVGLTTIVKPGGFILLFVPSRRALFTRLNLVLPQALKRRILFAIWPQKAEKQGFAAYYDRCTPREFRKLAAECGLVVNQERHYFTSSYFMFLLPLYLIWRAWILGSYVLLQEDAAETFVMALQRPRVNIPREAEEEFACVTRVE